MSIMTWDVLSISQHSVYPHEKGVGVDDAIDVYTSSVLNRTRSIWDGALQILLLVKASISCTATRELSSPSSVIPSDPSIFESFSNLTHFP